MIGRVGRFNGNGLAVVRFGVGEFPFHEGGFGKLTEFTGREELLLLLVVVVVIVRGGGRGGGGDG